MLPDPFRILYLHGFASCPASRKAHFFAEKLGRMKLPLEIPDLSEGDFERLTISAQLKLIEKLARGEPAILIGSSLGGYLAALYAGRHPEIARLVLLAPAFGFYQLWLAQLGSERIAEWKRTGTIPVYHYAEQRELPLSYEFLDDASRFEPFPDAQQPALLFHGNQDLVVPVEQSWAFVRIHPSASLVRLESGHELTDVLDSVWQEAQDFLLLGPGEQLGPLN